MNLLKKIKDYEDATRALFWQEVIKGNYERAIQVFEEGMKRVKHYKQLVGRVNTPQFKEVYE